MEKGQDGVYVKNDSFRVKLPDGKANRPELAEYIGKTVVLGIRPENIHDDEAHLAAYPECKLSVFVTHTEMMGAETYLYLNVGSTPFVARVNPRTTAKPDDTIDVVFDNNKIHLFDKETEKTIIN